MANLENSNDFSVAIVSSSHKNNGHHAGTLPRNSKSEDDLLSKNNVVINKKCNREGCNNDVFKEVCSYYQSYEIKSPTWTILWFRIQGIFFVENIDRLEAFMFKPDRDNSQLCIDSQYSSQ